MYVPFLAGDDPAQFRICKEEQFVFDDGATKCSSELILMVCRYNSIEVILGIQRRIAEILPHIPMKIVGSTFDGGIENCAGSAPNSAL